MNQLDNLTPEQRLLIELMLSKAKDQQAAKDQSSPAPQPKNTLPLIAQQTWFFENVDDYGGRWIWVMPYEVPSVWGQKPFLLEQIIRAIVTHHDTLRTHFIQEKTGWVQYINNPDAPLPFKCIDISGLEISQQDEAIKNASDTLQQEMQVSTPLFRMLLFYLGDKRPARMIIFAHHLLVDRYSLGILADDFQIAYQQLMRGDAISLPQKTDSIQTYIEHLQAYAQSDEMHNEAETYWYTLPWNKLTPLPLDHPSAEDHQTVGSMDTVEVGLNADETRILQTDILRIYKAQIKDVLLMAVMEALSQWTGHPYQLISWVSDGRMNTIPGQKDLRLTSTISWLSIYSYYLLKSVTTSSPREALTVIQDQLQNIPSKGMGWYIQRYYADAKEAQDAKLLFSKNAVVNINYLGTITDTASNKFSVMKLVNQPTALPWNPQSKNFREPLLINARIADGCFNARWEYNKSVHNTETIEQLAAHFKKTLLSLITSCQ